MDIVSRWCGAVTRRDAGRFPCRPPREAAMNVPRVELPELEREKRLYEIRREAEVRGKVSAPGVRPSGSPFPIASAETGYYGIPRLKRPPWTWEIPLYFFVGGAAGASAVVGSIARCTGADPRLVRDARWIAAAG